jgi:hypothetical protein
MLCAQAHSAVRAKPQAKPAAAYDEIFMLFPEESHCAFRHLVQNA